MPTDTLTIPVRDLNGRITRRLISFDDGGDSEALLHYSPVVRNVARYWIRRTSFAPSMMREPLYHVIDGSGKPYSAALPASGIQAIIDQKEQELNEYLAALGDTYAERDAENPL